MGAVQSAITLIATGAALVKKVVEVGVVVGVAAHAVYEWWKGPPNDPPGRGDGVEMGTKIYQPIQQREERICYQYEKSSYYHPRQRNFKKVEKQNNFQQFFYQYNDQIEKSKLSKQERVKKIQNKYRKLRGQYSQHKQAKQLLIKQQIQIIQNLYDKEYQAQFKNITSQKNVIFIGNTSSGKSKLINKLFDLNLPTGKGETTKQFKCVHTIDTLNNKINIFDSVGYNEQSNDNLKQYREQLAQINNCHLVFICIDGSMKSLKGLLQIICKSKQRPYKVAFVYTKCDLVDSQEQSIAQCVQTEIKNLQSLGIKAKQYPFFISSAKVDKFEGGVNQNYKIMKMINELGK